VKAGKKIEKLIGISLSSPKADLAARVARVFMLPANRAILNSAAAGIQLHLAGAAMPKYINNQKEIPAELGERNFICKVFSGILDGLSVSHPAMTMSDLQALVWHSERRLYDKAKG